MPKGRRPRGVSPCPRSGAAAESARLRRHRNGREELPKSEVRSSGWEELPHVRGQGWRREELPKSEVRGGGREELSRVRGQGRRREDQPHVQGAVAARAQEGLENLSHIEDQEGRR